MTGRDAGQVYRILGTGLRPSALVEVASGAWVCSCFHCKNAATIHGFARSINDILNHIKPTDGATSGDFSGWEAQS